MLGRSGLARVLETVVAHASGEARDDELADRMMDSAIAGTRIPQALMRHHIILFLENEHGSLCRL
jgi:hypothetical protein